MYLHFFLGLKFYESYLGEEGLLFDVQNAFYGMRINDKYLEIQKKNDFKIISQIRRFIQDDYETDSSFFLEAIEIWEWKIYQKFDD